MYNSVTKFKNMQNTYLVYAQNYKVIPHNTYEINVKVAHDNHLTGLLWVVGNNFTVPVMKTSVSNGIYYNEVSTETVYSGFINVPENVYHIDVGMSFNTDNDKDVNFININITDKQPCVTESVTKRQTIPNANNTNGDWRELITAEIEKSKLKQKISEKDKYSLIEDTYNSNDIIKMIEVLIGNKLTMGDKVSTFEKEFAKFVGSNYAVMVNSGSSANLLAMAVLTNHMRSNKLSPGDECLVPAICWSTSVYPIVQMGLIPIFVDSDKYTMNMDLDDMERKITTKTKCVVAVHILGNCTDMDRLKNIITKNNLLMVEDTCEALGSTYKDKYLGTFGAMGTYSFYYSHHITTIEGGMVVCDSSEDYELLKCLRAHGWTRYLNNKEELEKKYSEIDPRFLFVNVGYNLRPMEIQATMGTEQLKQLTSKNLCRNENLKKIVSKLLNTYTGNKVFYTAIATPDSDPAWFGVCLFLHEEYEKLYTEYLLYLTSKGVENRPIVTGNMTRQPVMKLISPNCIPENYPGAEIIHRRGFFIGTSCSPMSNDRIDNLVNILTAYF